MLSILGLGCRVQVLEFAVWSLGLSVECLRVWGLVTGFGFQVSGSGFRVSGFGFRVYGLGFEFRV